MSAGASAGVKAIKAFRIHQLRNLKNYVHYNGPLPPPTKTRDPSVPHRLPNPFVPHQNPISKRWVPPKVSLRRQADLIKLAKASNTLHLLPPGPKAPKPSNLTTKQAAVTAHERFGGVLGSKALTNRNKVLEKCWMNPVEWVGEPKVKEVAGSDVGTRLYAAKKRMFKGHRWERLKQARESKRTILMRDMARRVRNYKSYYRRRIPNPLKPSSSSKSRKLPF